MLLIALAAVFGAAGYYEASRHAKEFGHTPGGLPAGLWAAVCAVTLLIGAILMLLAARSDKGAGLTNDPADAFWHKDQAAAEYDDYRDLAEDVPEAPVVEHDPFAPVLETTPMKPLSSYPV
jgi:hypothetical protein